MQGSLWAIYPPGETRFAPDGMLAVGEVVSATGTLRLDPADAAVGPGARDDKGTVVPLDVKPGDRILFGKWSGSEVKIDGEELIIMKELECMKLHH